MKFFYVLALALALAIPAAAQDTGNYLKFPICPIATLEGCAGTSAPGRAAIVTDGVHPGDCDTAGGTFISLCIYRGGTGSQIWWGIPLLTFQNYLQATTAGDYIFHNNLAGAVDLTAQTAGAAGAMTVGLNQTSIALDTDGAGNAELVVPTMSIAMTEQYDTLKVLRFCGNGPNGTTENFWSPIVNDDGTFAIGEAGCDANDGTTIGNEDEEAFYGGAYIHKLRCYFIATAVSNTLTFTLYDDEGAVSTVTCNMAVGDSAFKVCTTYLTAEAGPVADGSAITVGVAGSGAGNVSAVGGECFVHFRTQ